ncbi:MAG TPA: thioredoxin domain-containing protein [Anaeromyxobacteraceae bacterium]|nr:thioredoxin domain-containing protein [Anaeromyxobacteraceae bacterium]
MIETPPGAAPFPSPLGERLAAAVASRGKDWRPRTRHLEAGRPRFTNRLALETSPYLQQHAHNPVNWYPWGEEAFEEARRTGRPVFLSVGYSTCHWCHVMEEESFEDLEVARLLNERYVAVKVDREERPDVDAVYMIATQALTGGGGWPMSVWLDHQRRPFYAGTYFPARDGDRGASRGFLSIAGEIAEVWRADTGRVTAAAEALTGAVQGALAAAEPAPAGDPLPGPAAIEKAVAGWSRAFDERNGGLRGAPKFPSSLPVRVLLRHHRRTRDPRSLEMAVRSLEKMAAGGMHDQVGGGFHRYSTDSTWLVPHFEKMLYDNALLAVAYAEAWQATGRADFARVVRTTLDYLLREMTSPEGGLYSATDADSEGVEGKFFVWSEREIRERLGPEADRFAAFYGVTGEGNFEGENVLHVPRPDEAEWEALAGARLRLLDVRSRRVPPLRDEKVLAAWNGLAISALAFGGRVLAEPRWVEAARRAAGFVLSQMRRDGRLLRSWKAGRAAPVPGFLEDHAFAVQGLLDLYEATFEVRWLREALELAGATERLFADRDRGGWFVSAEDHERLIAREKPGHDGAEPSGASVALLNAMRLSAFTADDRWRAVAERALRAHASALAEHPHALHDMLLAVDFHSDAAREVVLVWPAGDPAPEPFLAVLRRTFLPNRALAGAPEGPALEALAAVAPVTRDKRAAGGRPTAYVCERGACRLPAIEPEKLRAQVEPVKPLR